MTPPDRENAMASLCEAVRSIGQRGWTPARSGNFSVRLGSAGFAISLSGCDKVNIVAADLIIVDHHGTPIDSKLKPSAECFLHAHLYQRFANAGCVLHTHSSTQTLASLRYANAGSVALTGYELLKALHGFDSHQQTIQVPVVANDQHLPALQAAIDPLLDQHSRAYLIAGHGMYCWGADVAAALRHAEALDFILECELKRYGQI